MTVADVDRRRHRVASRRRQWVALGHPLMLASDRLGHPTRRSWPQSSPTRASAPPALQRQSCDDLQAREHPRRAISREDQANHSRVRTTAREISCCPRCAGNLALVAFNVSPAGSGNLRFPRCNFPCQRRSAVRPCGRAWRSTLPTTTRSRSGLGLSKPTGHRPSRIEGESLPRVGTVRIAPASQGLRRARANDANNEQLPRVVMSLGLVRSGPGSVERCCQSPV